MKPKKEITKGTEPLEPEAVNVQEPVVGATTEPTKLTSVADVFSAAKNANSEETDVDATKDGVIPEEQPPIPVAEEATTSSRLDKEAITNIVKDNDLSLMDKIEKVAKLLPQPADRLLLGLRGLYDIRSNHANNSTALNAEQRSFYRNFKSLLKLSQNEFNEVFRYIDWAYKQLLDVDVLNKEKLNIVGGVSPIHVMNIFMFIANKDDLELQSFIYIFTILDARATDTAGALKGKTCGVGRTSVPTTITEEDTEKINKYYNAD